MWLAKIHKGVHTTDKAGGFQNLLLPLFLTPQVGKCVDDHTKNEVENNDDDHKEEEKIVDYPGRKERLLKQKGLQMSPIDNNFFFLA